MDAELSSAIAAEEQLGVDDVFNAAAGFVPGLRRGETRAEERGQRVVRLGAALPPLFRWIPHTLPPPPPATATTSSPARHLDPRSSLPPPPPGTSRPPVAAVIDDPTKGRCLTALAPIAAGEVVTCDAAALTVATDPRSFTAAFAAAPTALGLAEQLSGADHAEGRDAAALRTLLDTEETKLFDAAQGLLAALRRVHGTALEVLRYPQIVASLLIQLGDSQMLHRTGGIDANGAAGPRGGAQSQGTASASLRFRTLLAHRHRRAAATIERLVVDCWRRPGSDTSCELRGVASAILGAVPASLLCRRCEVCGAEDETVIVAASTTTTTPRTARRTGAAMVEVAAATAAAGAAAEETDAGGDDVRECAGCACDATAARLRWGFLARHGLHHTAQLAALLAAVDGNAIELHVPRLPPRIALFPTLRLLEHECRPSCSVAILDSPVSHDTRTRAIATEAGKPKRRGRRDGGEDYAAEVMAARRRESGASSATRALFTAPSVAMLVAMRDVAAGERISIAYVPTACATQQQRQQLLAQSFGFRCTCRWCTTEPDLPRGFRCPRCPRNEGVVCPVGDGTKRDLWRCLQCGAIPDDTFVDRATDAERALRTVKADKATGLTKLLSNEYLHYTHALVFRKLDVWAETAWREQDAVMCQHYIEALLKAADLVMQWCDAGRAQYHEFYGQVMHALGNAHTARFEYAVAHAIRVRAGHRLTFWARCSRYMAEDKPITELMDSK